MKRLGIRPGRNRATVAALAALLAAAAALPIDATTLARMSLAQLARASSAVVRARCLGSTSLWRGQEIWTFSRFQSLESLRGDPPPEFTVQVLGGRVGSIESMVSGAPRFHSGEEVVLFLSPPRLGSYGIVAWIEGSFHVTRDFAGHAFLTQESAGELVYDAPSRTFRREGIRRMPLELFREKLHAVAPATPQPEEQLP